MFRTKRALWITIALTLFSVPALLIVTEAQAALQKDQADLPPLEAFRVLPLPGKEAPEITPFLMYQTSLAWHQDQLRQARWAQVKTESDLHQLQGELKQSVLAMLGGLPTEKTDLHANITGTISADGFHVEKLIYQSIPGLYVAALVYVPDDGKSIHPAVLVAAGHSPKGKIYYQDLCQRIVKRGYLVISWDPIGQGERSQFWDAKAGKSRYNMICAEHAVIGNLAYLAGTSLARWEIWDGMRAVDYLLSRNDVDAKRISITGTSGGGFQTALIGALDDRIQVIIPSCYITTLPMRISNRIFLDPDSDPEQDLYGFISNKVDHAGLLLMMYPRPVMVAAATLDFFPIQGTEKTFAEVQTFYERFGHADRLGIARSYNEHQFSLKNQEAALNFLGRFNTMPMRDSLAPVTRFSDDQLQVTKSGQVSLDYPEAQSLPYFIAQYSSAHSRVGPANLKATYKSQQDPQVSSWTVKPYTGSAPIHELRWESRGSTPVGTLHIDRYLLHHSSYLEMPLLQVWDDRAASKGPLLWFSLDGKFTRDEWPRIASLVASGYEVYSFDFRGLGETRMNYRALSPDDPNLVNGDTREAYTNPLSSVLAGYVYNSLLTGRPYFLQMLDDIQIAELFIRSHDKSRATKQSPITIAATSDAYGVALKFQQIDTTVRLLPASNNTSLDWKSIVDQRREQWPIAFLMPSGAALE